MVLFGLEQPGCPVTWAFGSKPSNVTIRIVPSPCSPETYSFLFLGGFPLLGAMGD